MGTIFHWIIHAKPTFGRLLHQLTHVVRQNEIILERSDEQDWYIDLSDCLSRIPMSFEKGNKWIDVDNLIHQEVMKI